MSLLVLGTVALDTVKTPFGLRKKMLGGSAVHFSMSARLFTDIHLVAVVGEDFPAQHLKFLKGKGIAFDSLVQSAGNTFHWEGKYEGDLNSAVTLNTHLGVLSDFSPKISLKDRKIGNIFLANIDPDTQMNLLEGMDSPRFVAVDSMNYWIDTKRASLLRLLKKVDIYVANDAEARSLSGETNLIKAAKRLRSLGPKTVLIKKGEHGVLLYNDKFIFSLPAYPLSRVIDPTGAGDTFAGGFMGYLARSGKKDKESFKKAICYGTVAASFNVEGFGVERTSRINFEQLKKRFKEFREIV
ncbi:MAG: bifunctional hydroxymethylpyrimidine kinase/phosphomethylpyrimidine kinase, partial [Candidatus Omnitrophica bacterium]|nr:bifunctional hydroxymethylpyrimidine kinase/phosphomethylpyrimidine kinase [Candidatus Omnitrophota bacterium]